MQVFCGVAWAPYTKVQSCLTGRGEEAMTPDFCSATSVHCASVTSVTRLFRSCLILMIQHTITGSFDFAITHQCNNHGWLSGLALGVNINDWTTRLALGLKIVLPVHCDCVLSTEIEIPAGSSQPRGFLMIDAASWHSFWLAPDWCLIDLRTRHTPRPFSLLDNDLAFSGTRSEVFHHGHLMASQPSNANWVQRLQLV